MNTTRGEKRALEQMLRGELAEQLGRPKSSITLCFDRGDRVGKCTTVMRIGLGAVVTYEEVRKIALIARLRTDRHLTVSQDEQGQMEVLSPVNQDDLRYRLQWNIDKPLPQGNEGDQIYFWAGGKGGWLMMRPTKPVLLTLERAPKPMAGRSPLEWRSSTWRLHQGRQPGCSRDGWQWFTRTQAEAK